MMKEIKSKCEYSPISENKYVIEGVAYDARTGEIEAIRPLRVEVDKNGVLVTSHDTQKPESE